MKQANELPVVTIGIPTFNRRKELESCLGYVLNQTYPHIRVIVSDNCTPGNEVDEFMHKITQEDKRVTYYKQEKNKGYSYNFAFVLNQADSDYFMWQADDDWIAPDFIEKIMNQLIKEPNAIAGFSNFIEVDENGKKLNHYPEHLPYLMDYTEENKLIRVKKYIEQYEQHGKAGIVYSIFRTPVLKEKNILKLISVDRVGGDFLINLGFLMYGKVAIVPEVLKSFTGYNVKYTTLRDQEKEKQIDLYFLKIHYGKVMHIHNLWARYLMDHFAVITFAPAKPFEKYILKLTVLKRIFLFYYDLFCLLFELRKYDVFKKIKREFILE